MTKEQEWRQSKTDISSLYKKSHIDPNDDDVEIGVDNYIFAHDNENDHNFNNNNRSTNIDTYNWKNIQNGGDVAKIAAQEVIRTNKYSQAKKILYPYRKNTGDVKILPVSNAGLFSFMYSGWMTLLMFKAIKKGIKFEDMWKLGQENTSEINSERLQKLWEQEIKRKGNQNASFIKVCFLFVRTRMIITCIVLLFYVGLSFLNPAFLVRRILEHVEENDEPLSVGLILVFCLMISEFLKATFYVTTWNLGIVTGMRLRGAVVSLVYKKLLRLRTLGSNSVGELVNICTNDGDLFFEAALSGIFVLVPPIMFVLMITYTVLLIGPWALLGCGTYLLFYPFQAFIAKCCTYYRKKGTTISDKRVHLLNGLLTNIKLIKMYSWEESFSKIILALRSDQMRCVKNSNYVQSINTTTYAILPTFVISITLISYIMTGNILTASKAMTIAAVFMSGSFSISILPLAVKSLAEGHVSAKRVQTVLLKEELDPKIQKHNTDYSLIFKNATMAWETTSSNCKKTKRKGNTDIKSSSNPYQTGKAYEVNGGIRISKNDTETALVALFDIDIKIKKGSLIGLCGSVGSGKSSFMSAILGEMIQIKGSIDVFGSVAFVPQQAWIFNAPIQENILFGLPFDKERYDNTVFACGLLPDFQRFPQGDAEEIGERGSNISGGQRQRLSLARAVYSNSDIYLLDDPLSALDNRVGDHIFNNCIKKSLLGKTIILASHQLQFIKDCDYIYFLKDGIITESGDHNNLMSKKGEYSALYLQHTGQDKDGNTKENEENKTEKPQEEKQQMESFDDSDVPPVNLIIPEEKHSGDVKWTTYIDYIRATGGFIFYSFVLLLFLIFACSIAFTNWWLSYWVKQIPAVINETKLIYININGNQSLLNTTPTRLSPDNEEFQSLAKNRTFQFYMYIHGAAIVAMLIFGPLKGYCFMKAAYFASKNLHNSMLHRILRSPMNFFDKTPTGRIINRFSKDLDEVDCRLPFLAESFLQGSLTCLYPIVMIAYVMPWFLIALGPLLIFFLLIDKMLQITIRDTKRMDSISRSPIVSQISTTIEGISCIRTFHKENRFTKRLEEFVDCNSVPFTLLYFAVRWVCFRVDLISNLILVIASLIAVLTRENISAAFAGLALSSSLQLSSYLQYIIRVKSETQARYTCVERICHYVKSLEMEAPPIIADKRPPANWPTFGNIKFKNVHMRYREGLPPVLKGVSFELKGGEKLGIVGRTGSGKSTLGIILFRLVEPYEGTIIIDGYNILELGLQDLRSRLSVIPQEPVLFAGTIRYNVDPFNEYSDDSIWDALDTVHLKDKFLSEPLKLKSIVDGNGENFSVGQRQLLCLARALLRRSKILLMDEATANVDTETDALIQKTIKESFADCTVLTIAHRLNTILHGDKIMVMDNGRIVEFNTPMKLIRDPHSIFRSMLPQSILTQYDKEHASSMKGQSGNNNHLYGENKSYLPIGNQDQSDFNNDINDDNVRETLKDQWPQISADCRPLDDLVISRYSTKL